MHPVGEDLGGALGESRVDPALLGHRTRDGGKAGKIGLVGNELSPICPPRDCLINLRQAVAKLTVAVIEQYVQEISTKRLDALEGTVNYQRGVVKA